MRGGLEHAAEKWKPLLGQQHAQLGGLRAFSSEADPAHVKKMRQKLRADSAKAETA
jgi:hypothetical protein